MSATEETLRRLAAVPHLQVSTCVPLSRYTRFAIGGPADIFAETRETESFIAALEIARTSGLDRVQRFNSGSAPLPIEVIEQFERLSGAMLFEGYGMTETSTVATVNSIEDFRFGSVGKPLDGVDMKIAEDGEILLRGANMMHGYYKNEEATKDTLLEEATLKDPPAPPAK